MEAQKCRGSATRLVLFPQGQREMRLFDPRQSRHHLRWSIGCGLATVVAVGYYAWSAYGAERWPGGSSFPGLIFGTLAGLIILFEFALWPRKWKFVRAWRMLQRTRQWMRAHIWLGLLSIPLVWMHTGFEWGGGLSTTLAVLYIVVIASGVYGLAMQNIVPKMLLHDVPAETIYSQIPEVCRMLVDDGDDLIRAACGWEAVPQQAKQTSPAEIEESATFLLVGAVRKVGRFQGKSVQTQVQDSKIAGAELVRDVYRDKIRPFLEQGPRVSDELGYEDRAREFFDDLRTRLGPDAHYVANSLESWCSQRRQFHRQAQLHWWLHSWLNVHLPLSMALVILLVAHIFFALKYW